MNDLLRIVKATDFAAKKHKGQRRKGANEEPYINHPLEVVKLLADVGRIDDTRILSAAVLHDTIEDTDASEEEIRELFGKRVCGFVCEVTDDKSLSKAERKQKQIEHAPHLSTGAKQIKIADKISNIEDMIENPPRNWSRERKLRYVDWSEEVIDGLRGVNEELEAFFDQTVKKARKFYAEIG